MTAKIHHYGPWQIPTYATGVLCPDGKRRYARIAAQADTFFSIPASVNYQGKTVAGFLSSPGYCCKDLVFHPYTYRKNGALFPNVDYDSLDENTAVVRPIVTPE